MADPIDRVKKLRALADRTTFPDEAKAARAKADALMAQHGLDEATVVPPQRPGVYRVRADGPWAWGPGQRVNPMQVDLTMQLMNQMLDQLRRDGVGAAWGMAGDGVTGNTNTGSHTAIFVNGVRVQ